MNFETLFSTKSQIGSKKSPCFANFHKISIFESQKKIVMFIRLFTRLMITWLLSYLSHYIPLFLCTVGPLLVRFLLKVALSLNFLPKTVNNLFKFSAQGSDVEYLFWQ